MVFLTITDLKVTDHVSKASVVPCVCLFSYFARDEQCSKMNLAGDYESLHFTLQITDIRNLICRYLVCRQCDNEPVLKFLGCSRLF